MVKLVAATIRQRTPGVTLAMLASSPDMVLLHGGSLVGDEVDDLTLALYETLLDHETE